LWNRENIGDEIKSRHRIMERTRELDMLSDEENLNEEGREERQ